MKKLVCLLIVMLLFVTTTNVGIATEENFSVNLVITMEYDIRARYDLLTSFLGDGYENSYLFIMDLQKAQPINKIPFLTDYEDNGLPISQLRAFLLAALKENTPVYEVILTLRDNNTLTIALVMPEKVETTLQTSFRFYVYESDYDFPHIGASQVVVPFSKIKFLIWWALNNYSSLGF